MSTIVLVDQEPVDEVRLDNSIFAEHTLSKRLPTVLRKLQFDRLIGARSWTELSQIAEEVSNRGKREAIEYTFQLPKDCIGDINGRMTTWVDAPFIVAEHYFYLKLLEIVGTGFFLRNSEQVVGGRELDRHSLLFDPFHIEKRFPVIPHDPAVPGYWRELNDQQDYILGQNEPYNAIKMSIEASLAGNWSDGSQSAIPERHTVPKIPANGALLGGEKAIRSLAEALLDSHNSILNIVCDNFYQEFCADLSLALTVCQMTDMTVRLWVKSLPVFVSDVTSTDIANLLLAFSNSTSLDFANLVTEYVANGRIQFASSNLLDTHFAFSSYFDNEWAKSTRPVKRTQDFGEVPDWFAGGSILLVKGDLNYRKLLGDRLWSPISKAIKNPKIDTRIFSIRAIKSPCLVGLDHESAHHSGIRTAADLETQLQTAVSRGGTFMGLVQEFL